MFPSAVRRIAAAAPPSCLLTSFAPIARATAALTLNSNPTYTQRRRYSSSKPSSPNDSPKGFSDGQVTAEPAQSTKQSSEKRRRKAKESNLRPKLPSVPSTQDVPQEALALSTFFSLHRPMSVTHSFPKAVTDDAFAQIFAPRSKSGAYNKVMTTLARAVDELEQPIQGGNVGDSSASHAMNGGSTHLSIKNGDGTESSIYLQLDNMSGQFLPFRPPPIPTPSLSNDMEASALSENAEQSEDDALAMQQQSQTRLYKAVFTLEETVDGNGNTRIVAHSHQLIEGDGLDSEYPESNPPRSFLERMAMREIRREQVRGQANGMFAISVRRQRKLKMKKKKYKKLMRRTRNERRKLDRV